MLEQIANDAVCIYKLKKEGKVTSQDISQSAYETLKALKPNTKSKIVLKPNVTIPAEPDSGIITHPDFIAGMVHYFLDTGIPKENIFVAEGGGSGPPPHGMDEHFGQGGYTEMAKKRDISLVNLNGDEKVNVSLPQAEILKNIGIARTVKDKDTTFINVPKFKTHNLAVTTLSMKNLMGTITPCDERHLCSMPKELWERANEITPNGIEFREEQLCRKLCDLSMASIPDFNIIEGIIGRDGTAFRHGKNIQTNVVIAGKNTASVDTIGTYLMGLEPTAIGYLKIAFQRGVGNINIDELDLYEINDGRLILCDDINKFVSPVPFEVLRHDKQTRDIPLNSFFSRTAQRIS
ncbi:DUF362 domain-containing protein [Candidatus Poribacteria bacterium]|nr:DUF362 domain-containing protein [Candidatus Poribacteria bacterium]